MSFSPTDVLKTYAHALQIAAPREWEGFLQVFDAYSTEITVAVTNARQDEVLNAQGRAQAFRHLLQSFRECHLRPQQKSPTTPPAA